MVPTATIVILILTGLATFVTFERRDLRERWMFKPTEILRDKQYERLLASGLIHLDWTHFIFNALTLYSFGRLIELIYGPLALVSIYAAAILGGSLLSLFLHRHHDYRALGASGGVCGVLFASIFLLPGGSIHMFFIPIGIPAWAYAILYLLYTFFALRSRRDNIGHDAHLGGAIIGLLTATALYPRLVLAQPTLFAVVIGLSVMMLLLILLDPLHLLELRRRARGDTATGDERERRYNFNRTRRDKLAEIDRLLDKVGEHGLHSLSPAERKRLDELSQELGR